MRPDRAAGCLAVLPVPREEFVEPGYLSAPRRRVTPVEEGSTQTVVGLIW